MNPPKARQESKYNSLNDVTQIVFHSNVKLKRINLKLWMNVKPADREIRRRGPENCFLIVGLSTSVTRWLYYLSIFGYLQQLKLAQ